MSRRKRKTNKFQRPSGRKFEYRGTSYSSDFEIAVKKTLDAEYNQCKRNKKLKFEFEYETDSFDYILTKNYTPDWPINRPDGTTIYIESKGLFDRESRGKMLAVKEQHPDKVFVILFQKDNPIHRGSKTRYSDWAEQHGFDWSVNCVPLRWLYGELCPKDKLEKVIIIDSGQRYSNRTAG